MSDFVELRRYITIMLRWWWLLILATVAGGVIGYWISQNQAFVYRASTTILVGQSIQATNLDSRDIQTSERLAFTYANIAQRQPVLQGVVDTLGLTYSWNRLKNQVDVAPIADTQLLEITVEAGSPKEAQVIADELAHQLILMSPTALENVENDENQQFVQQQLQDLHARISAGQVKREALNTAIDDSSSVEKTQRLQRDLNTLDGLIVDWQRNYTQLLGFVAGERSPNYLAVVEPAQADARPVRPVVRLNAFVAAIVGLSLALGFIFVAEYLDSTLKSPDDFSQSVGLPVLGIVGRIEGKQYQDKIIASQNPFSPVLEAYRMIRSNIQFMSVDRPAKIIMVTSPTLGEGKSTTVANLGVVMAQAGLKTIIVDADLRQPVQDQIFQVPNVNGLTDLLCAPELEVQNHLKNTTVENLQLITCGILPPNPSELLGSQRMGQVLADLHKLADVIIFDSSPVVAAADAAVLSNRVDGVVLVTMAGKTRREVAKQAVLILQQAGANFFGGILNRVSNRETAFYSPQFYNPNRSISAGQSKQGKKSRRWQWVPFLR
jgi:non-specific protein-tyrosine kinase